MDWAEVSDLATGGRLAVRSLPVLALAQGVSRAWRKAALSVALAR